jgi:hypothetical protein
MTTPTWNLAIKPSSAGAVAHSGGSVWNSGITNIFTMNYIDATNSVQTLWFRNLSNLLRTSPVVYLSISSNQSDQPNRADFMIKSLTQNDTVYSMSVQYTYSTTPSMGDLGSALTFYYYSS